MRPLEESYRILRVRVEAQAGAPGLLVVSSAMRGDGTTQVACGLARALAESGRRTLLVSANAEAGATIAEELGTRQIETVRNLTDLTLRQGEIPGLAVASLVGLDGMSFIGSDYRPFADAARSAFAFTVVDASTLINSSSALQLAQLADGLIVSVRLGRRLVQEDRDLVRLVGDSTIRMLGVVPIRARTLRRPTLPPARARLAVPTPEQITPIGSGTPAISAVTGGRR